jgi:hypothetical protein
LFGIVVLWRRDEMKIQMTRILCFCVAAAFGIVAVPAFGGVITWSNGNSTAVVDMDSQAGMNSWTVDGVNQLAQQWFWYSIGSGSLSSLDTLSVGTSSALASNIRRVTYAGPTLSASVTYTLTGGAPGSNTSDMGESIKLQNTGSASIDLHFYQYSNFHLGGGTANYLQFVDTSAVDQTSSTMALSETAETAVIGDPNHWQGGVYPSLLTLLNSGGSLTLNNSPAIGAVPLGPNNMSWAYEWDTTIPPNGTFLISKDKNIEAVPVPEPGTFALVGLGAALCGTVALRRRNRGKAVNAKSAVSSSKNRLPRHSGTSHLTQFARKSPD